MNITTAQEFKKLTGKTIYAIPTGNNARGWDGKFVAFTVISAKRKYVELQQHGRKWSNEYDPKSGADKQSAQGGYFNAGYIFFPTLESIAEYKKRNELADSLNRRCSIYNNCFNKMCIDDLESIAEILDKHKGE